MKMKCLPIVLFLFLIMFGLRGLAQLNTRETDVITNFGKQINADLSADDLHGSISVAVIKNNKVIWAGAFGYAQMHKNIIADTSSIYRIGSITKTFTATLLMLLVEEGKIKLDDPVETYVPEIKELKGYSPNDKITLRQLASHTAGLKREPDMAVTDVGATGDWEKTLISCIPHTGFNSKPGEGFLYSNMGFAILGLALERATNVPYIKMVQDKILTPLHMYDTFFYIPGNKLSRLAEGIYNNEKGNINTKLPVREIEGRGYRVPNGGIFSTPKDLAKLAISMMVKPYLLKPASLREMQLGSSSGRRYGLGLMLVHTGRLDVFGHDGSVPGYTSQMAIDKNNGYAVILMRNYNLGRTNLAKTSFDLMKNLE
jgi:CubicO group peptidase (beta-lactamase class C family)